MNYPEISRIYLHRYIDQFTDQHLRFKNVKELFPVYRHYSRVIVDMYFDHFCKELSHYHKIPLNEFSKNFYN